MRSALSAKPGVVLCPRGRGGDSVASSFALASTLEGGQVTAILREILDDLNAMDVWDVKGEDRSSEDLAADKRDAIERLLEAEDEENEVAEGKK